MHALAERLHLGSNAVTPLVDKLEGAGFVTRARGSDRRVVFVALTEAGFKLEGKVSAAQQSVVCRTGLADRDLADLRQELKESYGSHCRIGGGAPRRAYLRARRAPQRRRACQVR